MSYREFASTFSNPLERLQKHAELLWGMDWFFHSGVLMCRYDHRAFGDLSSKSFFDVTVKVFAEKGIKVYGFHQFAFTPLVVS